MVTMLKGCIKMPTISYLGTKGFNLTAEWQAYAIIGTAIIGVIVMIVGFIKTRKL